MSDIKKIDDGGPAFSGGLFEPQHGGTNDREPWNPGMSLRDWFAGQWVAGVARRQYDEDYLSHEVARQAYQFADAMIAARKGGA